MAAEGVDREARPAGGTMSKAARVPCTREPLTIQMLRNGFLGGDKRHPFRAPTASLILPTKDGAVPVVGRGPSTRIAPERPVSPRTRMGLPVPIPQVTWHVSVADLIHHLFSPLAL